MFNKWRSIVNPWRWIQNSFKAKLILSFFGVAYLAIFITGMIYYHQMSESVERNTLTNVEKLADQTVERLELQMGNIQNEVWGFFTDSVLQQFLERMSEDTTKRTLYQSKIHMTRLRNAQISIIAIYDKLGNQLNSGERNAIDYSGIRNNVDYESLIEQEKAAVFHLASQDDSTPQWRVARSVPEDLLEPEYTLSYIQPLKKLNTYSQKLVGVMRVDLRGKVLKKALSDMNPTGMHNFNIVDGKRNIIVSEDERRIGQNILKDPMFLQTVFQGMKGYSKTTINGQQYVTVYRKFSNHEMMLVGKIPLNTILAEVKQVRNYAVTIGLISLFVAMLAAYFISNKMTKPIHKLRQHMKQVEMGNFNVSVPIQSYDEIGFLGVSFNRMIREIDSLVEKNYEAELLKKDAEWIALQAQINPHFLYNALGTIDAIAAIDGNEQISFISQSLGGMFRYNISGGQYATLREEVHQVRLYLSIQQIRYEDRFTYTFDIEPDLEQIKLPKLILQPIIENTFKHGIEQLRRGGMITIMAKSLDREWVFIQISDNGAGIEREHLQTIKDMMRNEYKNEQKQQMNRDRVSIGLNNVNQRLRLFCNEKSGLTIHSEPGVGTSVSFIVPIKLQRGEEDVESAHR
ncbi:sensor histidine kinase YesM [Paenibacillus baekrokdamisoli]|uniref:Sensor histidine kinase YesM n=1 Tax=Paenibacillus baekrokdamisoli TaxID=1712516 RepID=A0A3G9J036_9BACL|nr:sensor histidine kinase [Paenibacillus baekrokdamisoli]MBB3071409.1 two-component system sensor histidine kinase YesM [Paenibacillus baekrokdamisoli]BBH24557.1 sensor histidine kinase YesM [Paenibacillus baekrokdamisoli]